MFVVPAQCVVCSCWNNAFLFVNTHRINMSNAPQSRRLHHHAGLRGVCLSDSDWNLGVTRAALTDGLHLPQHQEDWPVSHPGGGAGSGPGSCHSWPVGSMCHLTCCIIQNPIHTTGLLLLWLLLLLAADHRRDRRDIFEIFTTLTWILFSDHMRGHTSWARWNKVVLWHHDKLLRHILHMKTLFSWVFRPSAEDDDGKLWAGNTWWCHWFVSDCACSDVFTVKMYF